MIPVDYSDKESVRSALTGIDVVVSTIAQAALGLQEGIAEAAKEAGVKLFVPSEFGIPTEGSTDGHFVEKAEIPGQLKAVGMPYALFYTGAFADFIWDAYVVSLGFPPIPQFTVTQVSGSRRHKWESIRRRRW